MKGISRRALVFLATVSLLAACVGGDRSEGPAARASPSPPARAHGFQDLKGGWTQLPVPPEVRTSAAIGWTGEQLLVWGGYVYTGFSDEGAHDDGFALDARTRQWHELPDSPLRARTVPAAAWTGTELLVWGGSVTSDIEGFLDDGAAYDPASETWRPLPPAPVTARAPLHVWTGRELIVWGTAVRVDDRPRDGAAYDPIADEWRPIADGPIDLTDATAVWTGREMIVFGAALHGGNNAETNTAVGAAYDPVRDTWRELPKSSLSPQASTAAWNGRELIAWDYLNQSAAYDPVTNEWRRLPKVPLDAVECTPESVAVSGAVFGNYCGSMVVFDRSDERWHDVSRRDLAAYGFTLVRAGPVVLLMGRDVETGDEVMRAYRPG